MPAKDLKRLAWPLAALFVLSLGAMGAADLGLKGPAAPLGIISFQFCGLSGTCDALLAQWGDKGRLLAMFSLGVDYLFLVTYPLLVTLGLVTMLPRVPPRLQPLTKAVAWVVLGAGLADAIENFILIQVLLGNAALSAASAASVWAIIKFGVFYAALFWLLFVWFRYRKRPA